MNYIKRVRRKLNKFFLGKNRINRPAGRIRELMDNSSVIVYRYIDNMEYNGYSHTPGMKYLNRKQNDILPIKNYTVEKVDDAY